MELHLRVAFLHTLGIFPTAMLGSLTPATAACFLFHITAAGWTLDPFQWAHSETQAHSETGLFGTAFVTHRKHSLRLLGSDPTFPWRPRLLFFYRVTWHLFCLAKVNYRGFISLMFNRGVFFLLFAR